MKSSKEVVETSHRCFKKSELGPKWNSGLYREKKKNEQEENESHKNTKINSIIFLAISSNSNLVLTKKNCISASQKQHRAYYSTSFNSSAFNKKKNKQNIDLRYTSSSLTQ